MPVKGLMLSLKRQPRMVKNQGTELGTRGKPMHLGGSTGKDDVSVTPVLLLETILPPFRAYRSLPQASREGLTRQYLLFTTHILLDSFHRMQSTKRTRR